MTYWSGCHLVDEDVAKLVRSTRGPCPSDEELHDYHRGIVDGEVKAKLSAHIDLCGICQVRLERIDDFERATAKPQSEAPGWRSARKRLRKQVRHMASGKEGETGS